MTLSQWKEYNRVTFVGNLHSTILQVLEDWEYDNVRLQARISELENTVADIYGKKTNE